MDHGEMDGKFQRLNSAHKKLVKFHLFITLRWEGEETIYLLWHLPQVGAHLHCAGFPTPELEAELSLLGGGSFIGMREPYFWAHSLHVDMSFHWGD